MDIRHIFRECEHCRSWDGLSGCMRGITRDKGMPPGGIVPQPHTCREFMKKAPKE